jgi:long-chain acyl-CoA synthetase
MLCFFFSTRGVNVNDVKGSMYEYIRIAAMRFSNLTACEFMGKKTTYRQLLSRIDDASDFFRAVGIRSGHCVTLCLPNCLTAVISIYALNKIGAVVSPIHPLSTPYEIKTYTHISHSTYAITLEQFQKQFQSVFEQTDLKKIIVFSISDEMPFYLKFPYRLSKRIKRNGQSSERIPVINANHFIHWHINKKQSKDTVMQSSDMNEKKTDKLAVILFSGGTTGTPKGVMLSNGNFNTLAQQIGERGKAVELGGKVLGILPIFHGYGLGVVVHSFLSWGSHIILVPKFTTDTIGRLFKRKKPAYFQTIPRLLEPLLKNKHFQKADLSGFRKINCGGDKLKDSTLEELKTILKKKAPDAVFSEGYGLTETVSACMAMPEKEYKKGSIGKPLPGMEAMIVMPGTETEAATGQEGEICVRGPNVMMGYMDDEVETTRVLRKHPDRKLWLHTGDLGCVDEEGFYYFKERMKRIFKVSGMAVFPVQIEEVLNAHPLVVESFVIGVPDTVRGQKIKAIVVLEEDHLMMDEMAIKAEILQWCREKLIPWRCPGEIEIIGEMPKTKVGKVSFQSIRIKYGETHDEKNA